MILRNLTRDDGNPLTGDTVEILNAEDAQQNGVYTLASIQSDDGQEFDLTLVSQSRAGFVTTVTFEGEPVGEPISTTLQ